MKIDTNLRGYSQDKIGMGFYHMHPTWCSYEEFKYMVDLNISNAYFIPMDEVGADVIEMTEDKGPQIWVSTPIFFSARESISDYMAKIDKFVNMLKDRNLWERVTGFHWDEPLGHRPHTNSDFREMTKALWEKYGRRTFPVWSLQELRGFRVGNSGDPKDFIVLEPEATEFLTDTGFDVYGYDFRSVNDKLKYHLGECEKLLNRKIDTARDLIEAYTDIMMGKMMNEDTKIWYFPCSYHCGSWSGGSTDEDYCVAHLENFKDILLEQKHPGGLMCYTFKSWSVKERALDYYLRKDCPERWNRYEKTCQSVLNEIKDIKAL